MPKPKPKKPLLIDKKKVQEFLRGKDGQQSAIISLIIILVFIIIYFLLRPINIAYKNTKINIENFKKEKEILITKKTKLKNLEQIMEEKKDFIAQVKDILPTTPQIPEILVTLEELAEANSLYITNFLPKEKEQEVRRGRKTGEEVKEEWKIFELRFDLTGTYSSMKQFIKDLEKNIRPVDIKAIRFTGGGETVRGIAQPLRFGITAYIYYQEEG